MSLKRRAGNRLLPMAMILSLLVLGMAACGSDDNPADPTNPGATDTTPPSILNTTPASIDLRVAIDEVVIVTFSEAMDTTVTLEGIIIGGSAAEDPVWWENPTELHIGHAPWPEATRMEISITTAMKDAAGNALAANYPLAFFTGSEDFVILSTTPLDNATDVSRDVSPVIHFSQPVNVASLAADIRVTLIRKSLDLSFTLKALNDFDIELDFTTELPPNFEIAIILEGATVSLDGDPLPQVWSMQFTTGETGDSTAPFVTTVSPENGTSSNDYDMTVQVSFSEAMDDSIGDGAIVLSSGTAANITWSNRETLQFDLVGTNQGSELAITLGNGLTDLAGNQLESYSWSFFTRSETFNIVSFTPAQGSTNVNVDVSPLVVFSQEISRYELGGQIAFTKNSIDVFLETEIVDLGDATLGIRFAADLDPDTVYEVIFPQILTSEEVMALDQEYVFTFTTGASSDTTGPVLVSVFPPSGSIISPNTSTLVFEFNEAIVDSSLVITSGILNLWPWILDADFSNNSKTITFFLNAPLPEGTPLALVMDQLRDFSGNTIPIPVNYDVTVAGTANYFPVNEDWIYYVNIITSSLGSFEATFTIQEDGQFIYNYWYNGSEGDAEPGEQWFFQGNTEYVRFRGVGRNSLSSPINPPVRYFASSDMASAWVDTFTGFIGSEVGVLRGDLIAIEDVEAIDSKADSYLYWADCRHYLMQYYNIVDGEEAISMEHHRWMAPGVGCVKEILDFYDGSGALDRSTVIITEFLSPGGMVPLAASKVGGGFLLVPVTYQKNSPAMATTERIFPVK